MHLASVLISFIVVASSSLASDENSLSLNVPPYGSDIKSFCHDIIKLIGNDNKQRIKDVLTNAANEAQRAKHLCRLVMFSYLCAGENNNGDSELLDTMLEVWNTIEGDYCIEIRLFGPHVREINQLIREAYEYKEDLTYPQLSNEKRVLLSRLKELMSWFRYQLDRETEDRYAEEKNAELIEQIDLMDRFEASDPRPMTWGQVLVRLRNK